MLVFINYKRTADRDHEFACRCERWIQSPGYDTFRDERDIPLGVPWPTWIRQQVESCDMMLSLISNESLRSPWVLNEIDRARELGKPVIPVLLEDLDGNLEFEAFMPRFMGIQYYRATNDNRKDRQTIVEAIEALLRQTTG